MAKRRTKEEIAADRAKERRIQLESYIALRKRDFPSAILAHASYRASLTNPGGIGIDWRNYPLLDSDVSLFQRVYAEWPTGLAHIPDGVRDHLRVVACMQHMWGRQDSENWSDPELSLSVDGNVMQLADHLIGSMKFREDVRMWKVGGVRKIGFTTCNDEFVCRACKRMSKTKFAIDDAPELPHVGCSSDVGCRCNAVPYFED